MEGITPAINLEDGNPLLSPDDFQRLLYEYFEDRGILSNLRAHLRAQMIKVLKDTTLGKALINTNKDISPKLQALNLLIAEYLLQKQYHYSLSVFSTEVPISNIFPSFCNEFINTGQAIKFRFNDNDMWDILETLGFVQTTKEAQNMSVAYKTSEEEPLLNCIMRAVVQIHSKTTGISTLDLSKCFPEENSADMDIEKFVNILKSTGIEPNIALKLIEQMKAVIINEIKNIHRAKENELSKLKKKFDNEIQIKIEKYKKKLAYMESSFDKERSRLEGELENAKSNLKECAHTLQKKYRTLNKFNDELKTKEEKLKKQEDYLFEKEKMLDKHFEEIVVEKLNYRETLAKFNRHAKLKSAPDEVVEKPMIIDKSSQTNENINLDNVLLRQNAHQLQLEVNDLREQNRVYMTRIQEMVIRTNALMRELESSQARVQELNSLNQQNVFMDATPIQLPLGIQTSYRTRYGIASYTGGGEEGRTVSPPSPRQFRNLSSGSKRRLPEKIDVDNNGGTSSSDEYTPTEAILQEAKLRLRNLEQESEQIDKHYQSLKTRTESISKNQAGGLLHDFQLNIATIRRSLSRIFKRHTPEIIALNSGFSSEIIPPTTSPDVSIKNEQNEPVIKELIADLPSNIPSEEFENIIKSFRKSDENADASSSMSGILVDQSGLNIPMLTDLKSDSDQRVMSDSDGRRRGIYNKRI